MNIKDVIELVERHIADPESVGREELRAAYAAAAYAWDDAADSAASAASAALNGDTATAEYWVAEYHKSLISDLNHRG